MERNDLIAAATKLPAVDIQYLNEYSSKRDMLVSVMNRKMEQRADIAGLVGANNMDMMKDNHANHARFMESVFLQPLPEVLTDTVLWVFRAYRSRGFTSTYWAAQLNTWLEIYRKELSPGCFDAIYPYYKWMQINIPHFNSLAEEDLKAPGSVH